MSDIDVYTIFGYLGSLSVSLIMVPQVIKTYQIKHADQLSTAMVLLQLAGASFFMVFAVGIQSKSGITDAIPLFIANGMVLVLASMLLYMKLVVYK
jgi:MtN3 and saliva related transmembrane protein